MTTDQLNHNIADYCATRPEIVACYLYGSRAKGKDRPEEIGTPPYFSHTKAGA